MASQLNSRGRLVFLIRYLIWVSLALYKGTKIAGQEAVSGQWRKLCNTKTEQILARNMSLHISVTAVEWDVNVKCVDMA